MSFASSVKWELPLTDIDEVSLENLGTRPGLTEYGNAFHELNKVLRKDKFMKHTGKIAPPAIVFLTDGGPTDRYDSDLEELLKNEWFANASRGVILVGDAIDDDDAKNAVRRFVEDPEHEIVDADESDKIIRKIKTATMHAVAEEPREEDNTKEKLNKTGEGIPQGEDTEGPWGGGMGNPFGKDIGKIFKDIEDDIDIF